MCSETDRPDGEESDSPGASFVQYMRHRDAVDYPTSVEASLLDTASSSSWTTLSSYMGSPESAVRKPSQIKQGEGTCAYGQTLPRRST